MESRRIDPIVEKREEVIMEKLNRKILQILQMLLLKHNKLKVAVLWYTWKNLLKLLMRDMVQIKLLYIQILWLKKVVIQL